MFGSRIEYLKLIYLFQKRRRSWSEISMKSNRKQMKRWQRWKRNCVMHPCLFVTLWCLSCEPTGRTLPNSIGKWEVHLWQPLLGPEETWNMAHTLGRTSIWWASAVISLWVCGTVINRIVEYNRCYQCILDWFFPSYLLSRIQFPFSPWVPASTEFNADHSKQFTCLEFFVSFMYKTVLDG